MSEYSYTHEVYRSMDKPRERKRIGPAVVPQLPCWYRECTSFATAEKAGDILNHLSRIFNESDVIDHIVDPDAYEITGVLYTACSRVAFNVNIFRNSANKKHIVEFVRVSGNCGEFVNFFNQIMAKFMSSGLATIASLPQTPQPRLFTAPEWIEQCEEIDSDDELAFILDGILNDDDNNSNTCKDRKKQKKLEYSQNSILHHIEMITKHRDCSRILRQHFQSLGELSKDFCELQLLSQYPNLVENLFTVIHYLLSNHKHDYDTQLWALSFLTNILNDNTYSNIILNHNILPELINITLENKNHLGIREIRRSTLKLISLMLGCTSDNSRRAAIKSRYGQDIEKLLKQLGESARDQSIRPCVEVIVQSW